MTCLSLLPHLTCTTNGLLYFSKLRKSLDCFKFGDFCYLFEVGMPKSVMPQLQHIHTSTSTRYGRRGNYSITVICSPTSFQNLNPLFIDDQTSLLRELYQKIIITNLSDAQQIRLQPFYVQHIFQQRQTRYLNGSFA